MPWVYVRRQIARSWGVPPWEVDAAPWDEVAMELRLMQIEGKVQASQARPAAPGGKRAGG